MVTFTVAGPVCSMCTVALSAADTCTVLEPLAPLAWSAGVAASWAPAALKKSLMKLDVSSPLPAALPVVAVPALPRAAPAAGLLLLPFAQRAAKLTPQQRLAIIMAKKMTSALPHTTALAISAILAPTGQAAKPLGAGTCGGGGGMDGIVLLEAAVVLLMPVLTRLPSLPLPLSVLRAWLYPVVMSCCTAVDPAAEVALMSRLLCSCSALPLVIANGVGCTCEFCKACKGIH